MTTATPPIGRLAGRGLSWSLFGNILGKAGSFLISLVLARLLAPEDYGVFGIALAASQLLMHINDMGVIAATVQWRGPLERLAPTATFLAFGFSLLSYTLFWFAAPGFASLSGNADATAVVRALTLMIVIDGVTAVRVGALMRTFRQDRIMVANLCGFAVQAVVSVLCAVQGLGAWSFVWGQLANNTTVAVLVLWFARMPLKMSFDREIAAHLFRFGLPLVVGLGIEGMLFNVDKVVVGPLGAATLGFYVLASNVSMWVPGMVGSAIRLVALPGYARLAELGQSELAAGVRRSLTVLISFVLPFALVTGVLTEPLVRFMYGERWLPAAEPLRFLAVVLVMKMLVPQACDILTALGRTRVSAVLNLGWVLVLVPALYLGVHLDGVRGAAIAQALVALFVTFPLIAVVISRVGVDLRPIAPMLVRPLLAALAAGLFMAGGALLIGDRPFLELAVAGGGGFLLYTVIAVPPELRARLLRRPADADGEGS
ncbi:lipopolysaccharide biosynthesis protein [Actinocorallia lasiicapitis]